MEYIEREWAKVALKVFEMFRENENKSLLIVSLMKRV